MMKNRGGMPNVEESKKYCRLTSRTGKCSTPRFRCAGHLERRKEPIVFAQWVLLCKKKPVRVKEEE